MPAQVISHYFPHLIELHNYSAANSFQQKVYNLETLNARVFRKIGFQLDQSEVEGISRATPGMIERVLQKLQGRIIKYKEQVSRRRRESGAEHPLGSQNAQLPSPSPPRVPTQNGRRRSLDEEILLEKEATIRELQESLEVLELKIAKLEQLVRLKDSKIEKLQHALARATTRS
jgi:hypothetical protein